MTGSFYALRAKIQLYGRQRTQTPVGLQSICHIPELPFKKSPPDLAGQEHDNQVTLKKKRFYLADHDEVRLGCL